ncbi:MAG: helix-turn-helix domain-containing protein [Pseudonocardiaceae bacterium]
MDHIPGEPMGQQPNELTPHESLHHYWGAELRALRIARDLSLAELGQQLHCNPSYLAKIERAERPIPATLVESCDRALDASGALVRLHALAEAEPEQAAKPTHVASEDIHVSSQHGNLDGEIVVPVRTPDGRVVFVPVPRRAFLQGIGSTALGAAATSIRGLPNVGDIHPIEHFQQLRQVLIDNDNLFGPRQVIPMVREQIAIIQQLRSSWHGADQQGLLRVQAQYSELCGWLYQDAGQHQLAESWIDRALGLSQVADDQELTTFILTCKAHLAGEMRLAVDAVGAGERALQIAPPRSRLSVIAASRAAYGHALSGDATATNRAYDQARELLDTIDNCSESPYGEWLSERWLIISQAQSQAAMGDHHSAAQSFHNALVDFPGHYLRARGVCLARAALAHANDRQVEHAASMGLDALAIGAETRSARILTELAQLNDTLRPWQATPAVADFRAAVKDTIIRQA